MKHTFKLYSTRLGLRLPVFQKIRLYITATKCQIGFCCCRALAVQCVVGADSVPEAVKEWDHAVILHVSRTHHPAVQSQ